jgi:pectate lyase
METRGPTVSFCRFVDQAIRLLAAFACAYCANAAMAQTTTQRASPSFDLVGFATVKAYEVDRLTGGGDGPVVEVRTAEAFRAAVERSDIKEKSDRDNTPRVVKVIADIDLGELANERGGDELKSVGRVEVRSNTTIYAPGAGATIRRGIVEMHGAHNVIIRNLAFRDLWENDPTGKYDRFGWDFVRITNSGTTASHHVWIDHCDFGKCYDGQLDITHGSDLITVSWCHFAGDERGPHKKSMLIGHSSGENAAKTDRGRLNVTLHHNWFENIEDRAPRARFGNIHAFNNFVNGANNGTISVSGAVTLVENSVYKNTRIATTFSHAGDTVDKERGGTLVVVNSRNLDPRAPSSDENDRFELEHNFQSSTGREQMKFNAPASWPWSDLSVLPYEYALDPVGDVPDLVQHFAGTGKIASNGVPQC